MYSWYDFLKITKRIILCFSRQYYLLCRLLFFLLEYVNQLRLPQNHPCVIKLIRERFLYVPAERNVPYRLERPNLDDPSSGQSQLRKQKFGNEVGVKKDFRGFQFSSEMNILQFFFLNFFMYLDKWFFY